MGAHPTTDPAAAPATAQPMVDETAGGAAPTGGPEPATPPTRHDPAVASRESPAVSADGETRLLLVRHGHARAVDAGVVAGHRGCSGLSDLGRRQAAALGDRLGAAGFRPDVVVTSVLPRAIETATIVATGLGVDPACIPRMCELCERHPGEADGMTWDDYLVRYQAVDPVRDPDTPLSPGGESYRDFRRRVEASIAALTDAYAGRTVVAVVHGGVILMATLALLGLGSRWFSRDLANTSITEWVRSGEGVWLLRRFNDAAHLEGPPALTG